MAGRIFFGMLPKHGSVSSVNGLNIWGRFSRCSYSTAQRVETKAVKAPLSEAECEVHNRKVPTYKQVKDDPELQRRLAEMYKAQKDDPDFQQLTIESMKWGVRSLGEESH